MTLAEDILRMKAEGAAYGLIASTLGCSKGTIAYHCGAGQKSKNVERQRDRRSKMRRYIQEVKQASPCVDCGENYPYWIMQFDHLGDKLFTISQAVTQRTFPQIKEEIAKCEVVCANCHANRTHDRLVTHGGDTMLLDYGE